MYRHIHICMYIKYVYNVCIYKCMYRVYTYVYNYICVMCVCMYIYIYMRVCVCLFQHGTLKYRFFMGFQ